MLHWHNHRPLRITVWLRAMVFPGPLAETALLNMPLCRLTDLSNITEIQTDILVDVELHS